MRATQTCPKCAGKKFLVSNEFRLPVNLTSTSETQRLPVSSASSLIGKEGFYVQEPLGSFETWSCLGCGYTEFYAYNLEPGRLAALLTKHPEQVRIVDANPPEQGPYR